MSRKPIFDAVATLAPGIWNRPGTIAAMDRVLDLAGVDTLPASPAKSGLGDGDAFFAAVRARGGLFPGGLTQTQVDGINATLKAAADARLPLPWLAYVLATEQHETGGRMSPNRESLDYSVDRLLKNFGRHRISAADALRLGRKTGEPALGEARQREIANILYGGEFGRTNLGNTQPGDGWLYRGGGKDHCTGRRNYGKVDESLGLNGALLANPDLILKGDNAARAIVTGMVSGRYTNRKLADYLPRSGTATLKEFTSARPIINGTDRAADIAALAMKWQAALSTGRWS